AGVLLPGLARLGGCAPADEDPGVVTVDVSSLAPGDRLTREDGEFPFEVLRTEEGLLARSLLCTHQGCVVRWVEAEGEYHCPCHDARFDAGGVPRFGPARRPLRVLPVVARGDSVDVRLREEEG
ncbi:ubiquinol-cytochrome c reductase iron-sulfur subunit, partial [bacterium]|nr:ubiquinol-cytochrome c reductase iron-sulfur subunit [bacterium]